MQLEFEYQPADFAEAQRYFHRRIKPLLFWAVLLYASLTTLFVLSMFVRTGEPIPLLFCSFGIWFYWWGMPRQAIKLAQQTPDVQGKIIVYATSEALHIETPVFSGRYSWHAFMAEFETPRLFALMPGPNSYWIVPKRAFADEAQQTQFRAFLGGIPTSRNPETLPIASPD